MPEPMTPADHQLPLFRAAPDDPNLRWLLDHLDRVRDWQPARAIVEASAGVLNDRTVRALAAASDHIISGQHGYRHIDHATADEIRHAWTWLESQANAMRQRAIRIRCLAHARMG